MTQILRRIHIGVLALQGAFSEHIQLLKQAFAVLEALPHKSFTWTCAEIRTPAELATCDALIIPGGESTTISLVAARSELLELLRIFVKYNSFTIRPFHTLTPSPESIANRPGARAPALFCLQKQRIKQSRVGRTSSVASTYASTGITLADRWKVLRGT